MIRNWVEFDSQNVNANRLFTPRDNNIIISIIIGLVITSIMIIIIIITMIITVIVIVIILLLLLEINFVCILL